MADKKISALTSATTPLAGTEVLPIVQGGATVKVTVDNLTAGKAVSMSNLTYTGTLTGSTGIANIGAGQVYKDASGNVGIGTTSPSQKLVLSNAGAGNIVMCENTASSIQTYMQSGGTTGVVGTLTNHAMALFTNNTERMRIDTSGNVGIGTSSPTQKIQAAISSTGGFPATSGTSQPNGVLRLTTSNPGTCLDFGVDGETTAASWIQATAQNTLATNWPLLLNPNGGNVGIGTSSPAFASGTGLEVERTGDATVRVERSGATASAGEFVASSGLVKIGATGSAPFTFITDNTERMRLASNGDFFVGTTSAINSAKQTIAYFSGSNGLAISTTDNLNATDFAIFRANSATCGVISRVGTTSAVVYTATSDHRLKTVVGAVSGQGARIDALEPIEYTWNSNGLRTRGFLAHKFQEVYADSVTGTKDAVDADGNPVYQAMQASSSEVIADLVAEIQSLRQRLAAAGI
jgi:hypothetical protein